jgi:type I restriction enzyme S subunit
MSEWKDTDFGKIPIYWDLKKIIDIKSDDRRAIAMGPFGSNIKAENFVEDGVPVIRGTNLNYAKFVDGDFVYITEEKADELIGSNCKPGDLVFTHRGTIGQVGLIPSNKYPRYVISQSGMKLTVNSDLINNEFLFYFFKSEFGQYQILKYESQVGVPSISNPLTSLKEMQVPVPPIHEQSAIASVLSSLDGKIDLLHRQNATLEKMVKALFRQWFIEGAKEEWEEVKIKDFDIIVTDFVSNGSFASLKENVTLINDGPGYALFIRNTDLKSDFNKKVFVDEHAYNFLSKTKLFGGEVIISSVGDVGSVFRCPKFKIPMTLGNNVVMLKSDYNNFFYLFFNSDYGQSLIYGITSGSVQEKFNKTAFRDITINYPTLEYIGEFETLVEPYFDKIDKNKEQIRTLIALRDNLLPKLMSGEVKVELN